MDTKEILLENLKAIARGLAETYGRNSEVVVHDLRDLEHSVVYVAGNLTKREPGMPITDLVVKALRQEGNSAQDIIGYKTVTKNGRVMKSSTIFIRDDKGEIFASLCLNYDLTEMLNFKAILEDFSQIRGANDEKQETFATTVQETIESLVSQAVEILGKQPATMSTDDKVRLVGILENKGAFLIKGAVDYVAAVLGVSKFTIYNYLNKLRSTNGLNLI
ncbi:helix-turn-helix transcriptional regulator [Syntrophobotulus glycolicus]|uniref:helix-turn-helix transcriptional regulator n=1 Tax=Syntrophobotulus glycolicus TaxID=51197 RepID=UPI0002E2D448|nr:PAS domain-containing protein [Syntrophobotulus glycolicus]